MLNAVKNPGFCNTFAAMLSGSMIHNGIFYTNLVIVKAEAIRTSLR